MKGQEIYQECADFRILFGAILCALAAIFSALRGETYIHEINSKKRRLGSLKGFSKRTPPFTDTLEGMKRMGFWIFQSIILSIFVEAGDADYLTIFYPCTMFRDWLATFTALDRPIYPSFCRGLR